MKDKDSLKLNSIYEKVIQETKDVSKEKQNILDEIESIRGNIWADAGRLQFVEKTGNKSAIRKYEAMMEENRKKI